MIETTKLKIILSTTLLTATLFAASLLAIPAWAESFDLETKLTASDAAEGSRFGNSVALDGNMALIGARYANNSAGSVYLFDVATQSELLKLTALDAGANDRFGTSLAIQGNRAIVGAADDIPGSAPGSAYLFDVDPASPTFGDQLFMLTSSDPTKKDDFGEAVAISGNTAIVGSPGSSGSGSVYVFDVTTGAQLFELTGSDTSAGDKFGVRVAMNGNIAIIGASRNDAEGNDAGAAYLFDLTDPSNPVEIRKLVASDARGTSQFGLSVAIDGDTAIVGARFATGGFASSGAAYLFDVNTGNELYKLTSTDSWIFDEFGRYVAISDDTAIVGARFQDSEGNNAGAAYVFDVATGNLVRKLTASDIAAGDEFGSSVAIRGNTALVGSLFDDDAGINSGSVYLFESSIPEPSSFLLGSFAGLVSLGTHRRRRRSSRPRGVCKERARFPRT